ncbi:hypothetical protein ABE530_14775 [Brucella sp. TWI559]
MKIPVQFITTPLGEELALLPKADYEKLLEVVEDCEDIKAARKFRTKLRSGEEEIIPAEYVNRIIEGENKSNRCSCPTFCLILCSVIES